MRLISWTLQSGSEQVFMKYLPQDGVGDEVVPTQSDRYAVMLQYIPTKGLHSKISPWR
jgi:hypothetical protein